ncbi:MAG: hypothetical protein AAFX86_13930 [Pseudomonadota bacterium]
MKPTVSLAGLIAAGCLLAACAPADTPPTPSAEAANVAEAITITEVQMGDIGCYFILDTGESQLASFDLCDPGLAGTRHIPTYETSQVQSPACEGDPDCTLTVTESVIVDLAPVVEN